MVGILCEMDSLFPANAKIRRSAGLQDILSQDAEEAPGITGFARVLS
jgi:hypothetical protein